MDDREKPTTTPTCRSKDRETAGTATDGLSEDPSLKPRPFEHKVGRVAIGGRVTRGPRGVAGRPAPLEARSWSGGKLVGVKVAG